jgi:hypothetical protein
MSKRAPTKRQPVPGEKPAVVEPQPSFLASLMIELRAVSPVLTLAPMAMSVWLVWGALNHIKKDKADAVGWDPSDFSSLAWLILLSVLVLFVAGTKRKLPGTLTLVGAAGIVAFAAGIATFALGWANERQNYWDAYHFASLFWLAAGSALTSVVALAIGGRRGSPGCRVLQGPAAVCVAVCLVAWLWTWNPWLQGLEGWIARALFLATHG